MAAFYFYISTTLEYHFGYSTHLWLQHKNMPGYFQILWNPAPLEILSPLIWWFKNWENMSPGTVDHVLFCAAISGSNKYNDEYTICCSAGWWTVEIRGVQQQYSSQRSSIKDASLTHTNRHMLGSWQTLHCGCF